VWVVGGALVIAVILFIWSMTGLPSINKFQSFAERYTEKLKDDLHATETTENNEKITHLMRVESVDYKKTDSAIHPLIAEAVISDGDYREFYSEYGKRETIIDQELRYTIDFIYDGKWTPIKPGFPGWQWTPRIMNCRLTPQIQLFFDIEGRKSGESNG
jgi:hypothetical protein